MNSGGLMNVDESDQFDHDIMHGLLGRDEAALARLTARYASALTRAACLHLGDAHAAEDVAQETLIAVWDGAARVRNGTRLRPWMFGILFNRCRKARRAASRRRRREHAAAELHDGVREEDPTREKRLQTLQQALVKLREDLRSIVILRFERGFSVADVAEILDVPEGTVKSRTHAAIRALKTYVRQEP